MSIWRRAKPELPAGIYDEVLTEAVEQKLTALGEERAADTAVIREDTDVDEHLVAMIRDAVRIAVSAKRNSSDKLQLAQRVLDVLAGENLFEPDELRIRDRLLRTVSSVVPGAPVKHAPPPRGALLSSGLVTNAHGESVLEHLASEFATADRIDLLCSFIKLSGLDKFRRLIEQHRALGRPFRVMTTTYMRATDAKAIELLHRLGAEVRISYDDSNTRLHAKAWIFHRDTEYSTAYVGSSNLSRAAQTEGLEWNVRLAQAEQPELIDQMSSVFETYWKDDDRFEPFDGSDACLERLRRALTPPEEQAVELSGLHFEPRDFQKPILRELEQARALGRNRNLVVAATGTGKTLIAAFDYERLLREEKVDSLLFIAHRKEILEQSRRAFREVLQRPDFGELWVEGQRPTAYRYVFASIQSLAVAESIGPRAYDHVIVDEVHHAAADSYVEVLNRLQPRQLVGLTATPERADSRLYEEHFPRPYVGNLRVWDAIQQQVLVPFRYFVLDVEGLDLTDLRWDGGYVESELSNRLITSADLWVRAITKAIGSHIARPTKIRALAFCVDKAHARVVADRFQRDAGLLARTLTADTPTEERNRAKADLSSGRVQVLCVVDLFNEGVDIPDVNTLFLFRPTESTTVFLQQLGRGLRRSRYKDILTVFDVTGRQHQKFRFDRHLLALLGHTPRELREFVELGTGRLPPGCVLQFEEQSQRDILQRIKQAIPTTKTELVSLLERHRDEGWDLQRFLRESEVELLDLYRQKRSWTELQRLAGVPLPSLSEGEDEALANVHKLLHVNDPARLGIWRRLVGFEPPTTTVERRLAAMLFVVLYGKYDARTFDTVFERWAGHGQLRDEIRQLIPILEARADRLPRAEFLEPEVPLTFHGRYLDVELSAAFEATARNTGQYRNLYTGVERVSDGRYDLLLVTLEKGDVKHEHLRYSDHALGERLFQWQSQAQTRPTDANGVRHLRPAEVGVTPLLLVRESKKDDRGVTNAFRFLGPVRPRAHHGERPITIEWELDVPLQPEWARNWSNVA